MILPLINVNVLGAAMTAYFYITLRIASVLYMIPAAVSMSLLAEGSYTTENLRGTIIKAIKFTFTILIPSMILLFFFGDKILTLFGKEYSKNALELTHIMILSSIPISVCSLYLSLKRIQKNVKAIVYTTASISLLVIGLSYILMEQMGLVGVGLAWFTGWSVVSATICVITAKNWVHKGV